MPRIAAAERRAGNRRSRRGADGERFRLYVNVIIFIAIIIKRPVSLCPARGRDFGSTLRVRGRRLSRGAMGAPVGAPLPGALNNEDRLMLYWITADFWEAALVLKAGDIFIFLGSAPEGEMQERCAHLNSLNLALHLHPCWFLVPGVLQGCSGCRLSPPWAPRDTARWVLGSGTTSPGTAGTPLHPAWLGGKYIQVFHGAPRLPPSPGKNAQIE